MFTVWQGDAAETLRVERALTLTLTVKYHTETYMLLEQTVGVVGPFLF